MNDRTVVFLGPSLSHAEAKQILPGAICLPPAAMGDVLGASLTYRPHAIGLVDGTFLSNMSVFHKELLYAMDQGGLGTWLQQYGRLTGSRVLRIRNDRRWTNF
jgi:hypothetical protein